MQDIRIIRALYPHPMPARCLHLTERGYCVGGAIQCFLDRKEVPFGGAFPSVETLSAVLRRANPYLHRREAKILARKITSANDDGEFDQAWELAEVGITRHQPKLLPAPEPETAEAV